MTSEHNMAAHSKLFHLLQSLDGGIFHSLTGAETYGYILDSSGIHLLRFVSYMLQIGESFMT